jgi:hypothetical protein
MGKRVYGTIVASARVDIRDLAELILYYRQEYPGKRWTINSIVSDCVAAQTTKVILGGSKTLTAEEAIEIIESTGKRISKRDTINNLQEEETGLVEQHLNSVKVEVDPKQLKKITDILKDEGGDKPC